jgi:hypothetical protein
MNIKNKKSFSIKKLLIPGIILLLVLGGAYAYALTNNFFQPPVEESQTIDLESPNDPVPNGINPSGNTDKENLGEEEPASEGNRTVTITAASFTNDVLQVRALIQGVITVGSCTLTATQNGSIVVEESVDVQAGPSSSTCRGFDVDVGDIPTGDLSVTVSYTEDGNVSTSTAQNVELRR